MANGLRAKAVCVEKTNNISYQEIQWKIIHIGIKRPFDNKLSINYNHINQFSFNSAMLF